MAQSSFSYARKRMLDFKGGRVVLFKNESTGIAQIVLDHPEKRNAITGRMMVDFLDCVLELENWTEGKGVILRGNGNDFSVGGDHVDNVLTPQDYSDACEWMYNVLMRLQKLPLVSVCLVHGYCLGGGAEIATYCDYVVAAVNVKMGFIHGKLGIVTVWGGSLQLVTKIGRTKALDLLITAKVMGAEECFKIGLVEFVQPSPLDLSKTIDWLKARITLPREINAAFKAILSNASECVKIEREALAQLWGLPLHEKMSWSNVKHKM